MEVIIVVIVIVVAPLPTRPPPHNFQKSSKIDHFLIANFVFVIFAPVPIRFKVHNDIFDVVAPRGLIPTTLYVLGLLFYVPEHNDTKIGNSKFSVPSGR